MELGSRSKLRDVRVDRAEVCPAVESDSVAAVHPFPRYDTVKEVVHHLGCCRHGSLGDTAHHFAQQVVVVGLELPASGTSMHPAVDVHFLTVTATDTRETDAMIPCREVPATDPPGTATVDRGAWTPQGLWRSVDK